MGVAFLQPWVWWLAAAVAVPVAVHLLERERSRRLVFPSLRFLEPTRLSAVRRRRLQDVPLLAVRVAIVLAAVMALAGPIFITPDRQAAWARRVARAVVLDDRTAAADDELRSAAVGASFVRDRLGDAIRDAVRWLEEQQPVAREIVIVSTFRRGTLAPADVTGVPDGVGIRLVRTSGDTTIRQRDTVRLELHDAPRPDVGGGEGSGTPGAVSGGGGGAAGAARRPDAREATPDPSQDLGREDWLDFETSRDDAATAPPTRTALPGLVRVTERLTLTPDASRLEDLRREPVSVTPIVVNATPDEQPRAEAALRAVLRRGVRLPPAGLMQPVSVDWPGSADALATEIDARLAASLEAWEPEAMSDLELATLARPAPPVGDPRPEDAGDRRLLWGVVLALLAAETWIRRGTT